MTDVKYCPKGILVHGHRGKGHTHLHGRVKGINKQVWLDLEGIANILALCLMRKQFRITYDNHTSGACFYVHKKKGKAVRFQEHPGGLYFYDAGRKSYKNDKKNVALPTSAVQTVANNKKDFSTRQVKEAEHARCIYSMVG